MSGLSCDKGVHYAARLSLAGLLALYVTVAFATQTQLRLLTYNFPPYSMQAGNEHLGMAAEATKEVLRLAEVKNYTITSLPLKRAQENFNKANSSYDILYPFLSQYPGQGVALVGPIGVHKLAFFTVRDRKLPNNIYEQAILGVVRGSYAENYAKSRSQLLETSNTNEYAFKKLLLARVDAWLTGVNVGLYSAGIYGSVSDVDYKLTEESQPIYLAINRTVSIEQLKKVQTAYEHLHSNKYFAKLDSVFKERMNLFLDL